MIKKNPAAILMVTGFIFKTSPVPAFPYPSLQNRHYLSFLTYHYFRLLLPHLHQHLCLDIFLQESFSALH